ncbi:MAG: GspH/FimT family pseudopilin [Gammaproteobacteria bacterium]|nr:GspH/FimT family pseudopilin [Gammaproteobacteria bacterium]
MLDAMQESEMNIYGSGSAKLLQSSLPALQRGFTLYELIITIVIAGILVSVGVPSFQGLILDNRRLAAVNDLVSSFHYARSEAVKRGRQVSVCPTVNGAQCSGQNWENGWLIFVNNDMAPASIDAGDEILKNHERINGTVTMIGTGVAASAVTYQARGYPVGLGTFTYCDSRGVAKARAIDLSFAGKISTKDSNAMVLVCA